MRLKQVVVQSLLERSKEIAIFLEAIQTTEDLGEGRSMLIEGPAGIGKTTLISQFQTLAADQGLKVYRVSAHDLESEFAFGIVRQMTQQLFEDSPIQLHFPPGQHTATSQDKNLPISNQPPVFESGHTATSQDKNLPIRITQDVIYDLYQFAAEHFRTYRSVLLLDDIHWADEASLRFLSFLVRRLANIPLVLAMSARGKEEWDFPRYRSALVQDASTTHLTIPPLSFEAVIEFIEILAGTKSDLEFSEKCWRISGGNPFYLRELLATKLDGNVETSSQDLTTLNSYKLDAIITSLEDRLNKLPANSRSLAYALAVLGDRSPSLQLASLSKVEPRDLARTVDQLRAVRILAPSNQIEFLHPIVKMAIYSSIPIGHREELHKQAAEITFQDQSPSEVSAAHILHVSPKSYNYSLSILEQATKEALSRGAPESCVKYLNRALEEEIEPAKRFTLLYELGYTEALARLPEAENHLMEVINLSPDPNARLRSARVLWSSSSFDGRSGEGLSLLRDALSQSENADPELIEWVDLELARATRSWRPTASEGVHRILALEERISNKHSNYAKVAYGLLAYNALLSNQPAKNVLELVSKALPIDSSPESQSESQLLELPLYTMIYCDAFDLAHKTITNYSDLISRQGFALGKIKAELWSSFNYLRQGNLLMADELLSKSLAGSIDHSWLFGQAASQLWLAEIAIERGNLKEAKQYHKAIYMLVAPDREIDNKGWADHILSGRAHNNLAQGKLLEAIDEVLLAGRRHNEFLAFCPSELQWRSLAALGCHKLANQPLSSRSKTSKSDNHSPDQTETLASLSYAVSSNTKVSADSLMQQAASLATEEVELAHQFGAPRALGIALRTHGYVVGSEASYKESLQVLSTSGAQLELARTQCVYAKSLMQLGRSDDARALFESSLEIARTSGASHLVKQIVFGLKATGGKPKYSKPLRETRLTSGELKVAHLAAKGLGNLDIARSLYISRRTVETHLYNIYRKLNITTRSELQSCLETL